MFSLFDIEGRISVFKSGARDFDVKADAADTHLEAAVYSGVAAGFREAARSLERLVDEQIRIEDEVRGL